METQIDPIETEPTQDDAVEYDAKVLALAQLLGANPDEITEERQENLYSFGSEEYLVLTDSEADTAYDNALENYLDEVIYPEIPEPYRFYFDDEKWKNDARINGDRASELGRYDSNEHEETVDSKTFYLYRQN